MSSRLFLYLFFCFNLSESLASETGPVSDPQLWRYLVEISNSQSTCYGSMIGPQHILVLRHCVNELICDSAGDSCRQSFLPTRVKLNFPRGDQEGLPTSYGQPHPYESFIRQVHMLSPGTFRRLGYLRGEFVVAKVDELFPMVLYRGKGVHYPNHPVKLAPWNFIKGRPGKKYFMQTGKKVVELQFLGEKIETKKNDREYLDALFFRPLGHKACVGNSGALVFAYRGKYKQPRPVGILSALLPANDEEKALAAAHRAGTLKERLCLGRIAVLPFSAALIDMIDSQKLCLDGRCPPARGAGEKK